MLRNILAATLANLARNRLYAAISIASLAIGMAAAILTGLYLRDELGFDRFIPGYRNVFVVVADLRPAGAADADIVALLFWSFTRPVLWANLIAWPVGWLAMSRWLEGFSARIELSPLYFIAAGAAALLIAALTVFAHALRVARAKPVGALRYE